MSRSWTRRVAPGLETNGAAFGISAEGELGASRIAARLTSRPEVDGPQGGQRQSADRDLRRSESPVKEPPPRVRARFSMYVGMYVGSAHPRPLRNVWAAQPSGFRSTKRTGKAHTGFEPVLSPMGRRRPPVALWRGPACAPHVRQSRPDPSGFERIRAEGRSGERPFRNRCTFPRFGMGSEVRLGGFEPPTRGLEVRCSVH
jgi:hypothetical protein